MNGRLVDFLCHCFRCLAYCQIAFFFFYSPVSFSGTVYLGAGSKIFTICNGQYAISKKIASDLSEAKSYAYGEQKKCLEKNLPYYVPPNELVGVKVEVEDFNAYNYFAYVAVYLLSPCNGSDCKPFSCDADKVVTSDDGSKKAAICNSDPPEMSGGGGNQGCDWDSLGELLPGDFFVCYTNPENGDPENGDPGSYNPPDNPPDNPPEGGGGGDNPGSGGGGSGGGDNPDENPDEPGEGGGSGDNSGSGGGEGGGNEGNNPGGGSGGGGGGGNPPNPNDSPDNPPEGGGEGGGSGGGSGNNPGGGDNPGNNSGGGGNGDNDNPGSGSGGGGSGGGGTSVNVNVDLCKKNPSAKLCQAVGNFSGNCNSSSACSGDPVECAQAKAVWQLACAQDARDVNGGGYGGSGGVYGGGPGGGGANDCKTEPKCKGDPIDCAMLIEQHRSRCSFYDEELANDFSQDLERAGQGGEAGGWQDLIDKPKEKDVENMLQPRVYFSVSNSCPGDMVIPFFGHTIVIQMSWVCSLLNVIRFFFTLAAWLYVIRLFFNYFSKDG